MKNLFITGIMIVVIILFLVYPKTNESKDNSTKGSTYDFYKKENEDRYKTFQDKHKDLSFEDVIIRVNLNLDKDFYTDTTPAKDLNTTYILVNKYNYLTKNYIPNNLVKVDRCTNKELFLVKEARDNFVKMCDDLNKVGMTIRAISGYRSYSYQESLYNNYVKKDGTPQADTYSARPGFSEHQTGLVIDLDNGSGNYENFDSTNEFIWLKNNAYKYGFILRYPQKKESITGYSYESWHYRYVGESIAKKIYNSNITFDEYYIKFINK